MNEISDSLMQKEKELMNSRVAAETFKVGFKLLALSPGALATAMRLAVQTTKGFTDMGIDTYNTVRNSDKKAEVDKTDKLLKSLKRERKDLDTELSNGSIDRNFYTVRKKALDKEIRVATENLDRLKNTHHHKVEASTSYRNITRTAERKGQTLESTNISDKKMLGFEMVARKYGIDYGLMKVKGSSPPEWEVYFMAKDRGKMTNAFKEFTQRERENRRETPMEKMMRIASKLQKNLKLEKVTRRGERER